MSEARVQHETAELIADILQEAAAAVYPDIDVVHPHHQGMLLAERIVRRLAVTFEEGLA